eukprot:6194153-Pleurochrysis_carterae.AAC.3
MHKRRGAFQSIGVHNHEPHTGELYDWDLGRCAVMTMMHRVGSIGRDYCYQALGGRSCDNNDYSCCHVTKTRIKDKLRLHAYFNT